MTTTVGFTADGSLIGTPVDVVGEQLNVVQQIVCNTEHLLGKSSSMPLIEGKLHGMNVAPRSDADSRPDQGSACGGVLRNDLGWALGVVFRSYLKAANAAFADVPGGPRGYQVLAAATRGEPESQLALAQHQIGRS